MSGRHSGPKISSGARGKKIARTDITRTGDTEWLPQPLKNDPQPMSGDAALDMLEGGVSRVRKLTREHDQLAVDTLASICGDPEATDSSRVAAATRILEYSHGRPIPLMGSTRINGAGNALTINVLRFSDEDAPVTIDVQSEEE